ncbi:hypothetical protein [Rodentibacter trehalosifermentans]|uniref:hypothetical protein n=1 Tax=Rodentibacter trehalosifermentans TaxID=1908263 RepID=UPI001F619F67|nr:hypothetical protein [Rodentibacter trehalosifermentans]
MEAVATLLNTLVLRILFGHFTMFLVFLFVGFAFMPPEWALYLNAKTPAFFPDWFTLANFGSFVFACVATMIWILVTKPIVKKAEEINRFYKNKAVLESLSDDEIEIVYSITENHFRPKALDSTPDVISLLAKGVIVRKGQHWGESLYQLTPSFKACFLKEYAKSSDRSND